MICFPEAGVLVADTVSPSDAAALRRKINPDRCALPDVLGRRRDHAQLVPSASSTRLVRLGPRIDLPDYFASEHVIHALRALLSRSPASAGAPQWLLRCRERASPGAAQLATGAGEVGFIERLSLDDVARSDETGHEFRTVGDRRSLRRAACSILPAFITAMTSAVVIASDCRG